MLKILDRFLFAQNMCAVCFLLITTIKFHHSNGELTFMFVCYTGTSVYDEYHLETTHENKNCLRNHLRFQENIIYY